MKLCNNFQVQRLSNSDPRDANGSEHAIRNGDRAISGDSAKLPRDGTSKARTIRRLQQTRQMHDFASPLTLGQPRFEDAQLETVSRTEGQAAAWSKAFERDGGRAAANVRGPFAVGLASDGRKVFLAVDRFAIKTLCYRVVDGTLHFAERADELAAIEPVAPIDPQAIFDYLYFHVIPSPRTVYEGVCRLPPGHFARFENGRLELGRYWDAVFVEPAQADFETLAQEFRTLLRRAVADQLDGSKPACFLSGGTDSSTVAGLIGEVAGTPASTYSIGFEAEGYDEMAFARIAARRFGTDHHEYYVTPADLLEGIPKVAAFHDQPFGNSSAVPAYYCAKLAKEDGVSLLLAGDGGDELFGGNTRYAKQRVFEWYGRVPAALRSLALEPLLQRSPIGKVFPFRKGASYIEQARVPLPDRMQMYNLLHRLGPESMLSPQLLGRIDQLEPLRHQRDVWGQASAGSNVNRMLAYDWRYTLAEADLPKVCGSTALAGVAVGFPFLDLRLLELSMRLPTTYKLKGLQLRWFFKKALQGFLPDEIIAKKKHGFGLPFGVWATRHQKLHDLAMDSLASLGTRGIVRPDFIKRLAEDLLPAHPGYYGEMVWILMMLEQWLRRYAPNYRMTN
jgi:asparagine synthase (glutamine-hydrolysing)